MPPGEATWQKARYGRAAIHKKRPSTILDHSHLSLFVDEAVCCHVLDLTVRGIKNRNARHDQQNILDVIDEEVDAARGVDLLTL